MIEIPAIKARTHTHTQWRPSIPDIPDCFRVQKGYAHTHTHLARTSLRDSCRELQSSKRQNQQKAKNLVKTVPTTAN
eukprot:6126522-Amphidinium_carterae.1